jgi:hypothetical protein
MNEKETEYTLLNEVKICNFTGKKYDAVRKVKCTCKCHSPREGEKIIHFMPCCDDGLVEEYRYIEDNNN